MSALAVVERAPAYCCRGEHHATEGGNGVLGRGEGEHGLSLPSFSSFFRWAGAGVEGLGGLGVRAPIERGLHAVSDAGWQLIRPERDGGGADSDCSGCRCRSAAQECDGVGFVHAPMLVHLPANVQVDLQPPLLKYAYMKTLAERTQDALDAGFTVGALAVAANKSSSAVSQWLNGPTKTIKADSALGLERLTGWSAAWWITGKGERGATKTPAAAANPLTASLAELGRALAQSMPDHVRQDVAHLLSNLALRHGLERHQSEIVGLLESVEAMAGIPSPGLDLAQTNALLHPQDANIVTNGGDTPQERGTKWGQENSEKSPPAKSVDMSDRKGGAQPVLMEPGSKKPGKGRAK